VGHHDHDTVSIGCAIVTVSDTRTASNDGSGQLIRTALEAAGHRVHWSEVVADDAQAIRSALEVATTRDDVTAVVLTGGTGIGARDVTLESLSDLWTKELPGFGEIFRSLSFAEIGPAAILSRAAAGVINGRFVAALPGSPAACRLAIERLLVPVLGHVAALLERR
jgi:molybdenum cofactor biosynthesis protein B